MKDKSQTYIYSTVYDCRQGLVVTHNKRQQVCGHHHRPLIAVLGPVPFADTENRESSRQVRSFNLYNEKKHKVVP